MEEEEAQQPWRLRPAHIKKKARKNKSPSVAFNEKDLKDYVSGFHKRKKKRRKEAQQKLQEAERRKRIEIRKKRKLEREFAVYGGAPPDSNAEPNESGEDGDGIENEDPIASVSGTATYDSSDVRVTVTTSEISREEDEQNERPKIEAPPRPDGLSEMQQKRSNRSLPVTNKKQFKKVAKRRSHPKPQSKRDKRKGKKKNNKR